jgi:PAP2 superfamily protein
VAEVGAKERAATSVPLTRPRLRWWFEVLLVLSFYGIYSSIRNVFGSAAVGPDRALTNAHRVIDVERAVGLFHEEAIQRAFIDWSGFIRFWNIFYGTFHFIVTIFALLWLFVRFPLRYEKYRNVLLSTTALALVGFSLFPLMPPRLLDDCISQYGGCSGSYGFVDTLRHVGGLWSFDSGAMSNLSNQYAAMPSLHFGWSMWCCIALVPTFRSRIVRALLIIYPWVTLFAIIVTANHYWLDALGGAWVLLVGYFIGTMLTRLSARLRLARVRRRLQAEGGDEPGTDTEPVLI